MFVRTILNMLNFVWSCLLFELCFNLFLIFVWTVGELWKLVCGSQMWHQSSSSGADLRIVLDQFSRRFFQRRERRNTSQIYHLVVELLNPLQTYHADLVIVVWSFLFIADLPRGSLNFWWTFFELYLIFFWSFRELWTCFDLFSNFFFHRRFTSWIWWTFFELCFFTADLPRG